MSDAGGRRGWSDRIRDVGDAFLGVVRAELTALATDLGRSGRAFGRALVWVAAALGVAFWTVGLAVYSAVELLALVLPRWGAALVVLGLFLIAGVALVLVARARFAAIEPPDATVKRRLEESQRWWRERVARDELEELEELEEAASPSHPRHGEEPR